MKLPLRSPCACLRLVPLVAALAILWAGAAAANADLLLCDSFGYEPIVGTSGTRYDAASNTAAIFPSHDLSGLRAEFPSSSTEVWTAPSGHQVGWCLIAAAAGQVD